MASQRQIQSSDQKTEQVSIPPHSTEAEQAVLGGIIYRIDKGEWKDAEANVPVSIKEYASSASSSLVWKSGSTNIMHARIRFHWVSATAASS